MALSKNFKRDQKKRGDAASRIAEREKKRKADEEAAQKPAKDAAKKRNITVTNTPEVLTDATAEIGFLLILIWLLNRLYVSLLFDDNLLHLFHKFYHLLQ